jgi:putative transposase
MARPAHPLVAQEYVQHLTWTTKGREPFFGGEEGAAICLQALENERERMRIEVYAYALMPDHFHIITAPSVWPVGTVVQWLKLSSAYRLRTEGFIVGSPWARGYWDKAIHNEEQLRNAANYIHNNPVTAELCEQAARYQFSSCAFYDEGVDGLIKVTVPPL